MRKRAVLAAILLGWSALADAEKLDYQIAATNDDAEEEVSSGNMYRNSSDLELIADGSTNQLIGLRFQNIQIPQGTTIVSAVLEFETDETNSGATSVTIEGEDINDAPQFGNGNSNISNRARTSASVDWNSIPAWNTVSERHQSPDITSIVQEIVDRGGWSAGSDMVFIITGSGERTAESYDGEASNAPILRIEIAGITPAAGAALCYGVADGGNRFVLIDITDGTVDTNVGNVGVSDIEAIAIDPEGLDVYGADADQLGRINTDTGEFIRLTETFGTGSGSTGNITFDDVDSLAFDHDTGTMWGVDARGGADALFQIDPDTGAHVPDAFGVGVDYVLITGTNIGTSIDDIAIDPSTGVMYGADTTNSQLITLNTSTGAGTVVGSFGGSVDMEGMGFHSDGTLYGTEGRRVYTINTSTGAATQVGSGNTLNVGSDYEGFDCHFTALTRATIARFDVVADGDRTIVTWETSSENGTAGFYLYRFDFFENRWILTHDGLLPGLQSAPQGGTYRLIDETVGSEERLYYTLVEVEVTGKFIWHSRCCRASVTPDRPLPGDKKFIRRTRRELKETLRPGQARRRVSEKFDLKVLTRRRGLHHLSIDEIAGALGRPELAPWVARQTGRGLISLRNRETEVPWLPATDGTGLSFYAPEHRSLYSEHNVFHLQFVRGTTMERAGLPTSGAALQAMNFVDRVTFEEDRFAATVVALDPDSDYWFWEFVSAGDADSGSRRFTLDVPSLDARGRNAYLEVELFGATHTGFPSEHRATIRLNGVDVGATVWSGIGTHEVAIELPVGLLQEGDNVVEVEGILDGAPYSVFYIDAFALRYARRYEARDDALHFNGTGRASISLVGFSSEPWLFDISDATTPFVVNASAAGTIVPAGPEREYLAVGAEGVLSAELEPWVTASKPLKSRDHRIDYLVIAADALVDAAQSLADYRESQGLRTMLVGVSEIENAFNDGFRSPYAIRDFLLYASKHWTRAPRYVVLVGEGSFDYRNLLGQNDSLVASLLRRGNLGIYAADNALGSAGEPTLPLMAIGRIPVTTEAQLETYVAKVRAFEGSPGIEAPLLLSDVPDVGGNFAADGLQITATLADVASFESISLEELPVNQARERLFARLNEGAGLMVYTGHGGLDRLSSLGLLTSYDSAALESVAYPPILVSLSCSTNRFDIPGFDSLGETLVRQEEGGLVAAWAPTALTSHGQSTLLGQAFLEHAYRNADRLGDAMLYALRDYSQRPDAERLLRAFNLLGDPALRLR